MSNVEKISFVVLLLLALLLAGHLVYYHNELMQPASESISPFVDDRVVEIRIVMDEDDWQQFKTNAMAEQYVRADFWFDGEPWPNIAVRPKGNSSLRHAAFSGTGRVSLKIDFNFFNFAQTFRGLKKLNLNNCHRDPTFIRETIAYELFKQMDIPTPQTAFTDVWVNDTHLGLYTMVEQVDKVFLRRHFSDPEGNLYKPEERPAALDWTKEDFDRHNTQGSHASKSKQNNLDIKIGGARLGDLVKILKKEGAPGSEMLPDDTATSVAGAGRPFPRGPGGQFPGPFPGDPNRPFPGGPGGQFPRPFPGDPNRPFGGGFRARGGFPGGPGGMFRRGGNIIDLMGLKTNENYPDHTALLDLLEVLNNCPDDSFPSEIEKVLDVDGALRFLAASVLIVHLDNYIGSGHNYYFYEADGKFSIIPWDLNEAFGTFDQGLDREGLVNLYIDEPTIGPVTDRPLVARLLTHKPYLETYHQYLEQLLNGGFAEGVIESRIDEVVKMIRPFVESDDLKFYSTADFEKSIDEDLPSDRLGGFPPGMPPMPGGGIRMPGPIEMRMQGGPSGGPGRRRGPMGPPRGGAKALGLKSFIKDRRLSVRQQLDGNIPSRGDGRGNRGHTDMLDRFRRDRRESR